MKLLMPFAVNAITKPNLQDRAVRKIAGRKRLGECWVHGDEKLGVCLGLGGLQVVVHVEGTDVLHALPAAVLEVREERAQRRPYALRVLSLSMAARRKCSMRSRALRPEP